MEKAHYKILKTFSQIFNNHYQCHSLFTIIPGKIVNFKYSNPSTLLLRMVIIKLIILQQGVIVRYPHLTRSLTHAGIGMARLKRTVLPGRIVDEL